MLTLEGFMNVKDLKQQGLSVSALAEHLDLDRNTVRKYLVAPPQPYRRRAPTPAKIEPYNAFLRESWEQGVHNASKLRQEIRGRGYPGGYSQLKLLVAPWHAHQFGG
jgi:transposase